MSEIIDGMDQLDIFDWLGDEAVDEAPVAIEPCDMLGLQSYLPSAIRMKYFFKHNSYKLKE